MARAALAARLLPARRDADELPGGAAVPGHRPAGARQPQPRRHQPLPCARLAVRGSGRAARRRQGACRCWCSRRGCRRRELFALVCGLVAVMGHVFSVFVGFKGGKGVATAAGVMLGLTPAALGVAVLVWAALVYLTGLCVARQHRGRGRLPGGGVPARAARPAGHAVARRRGRRGDRLVPPRATSSVCFNGTENRFGRRAATSPRHDAPSRCSAPGAGARRSPTCSPARARRPALGLRAGGRRGDQPARTRTRCSCPGVPLAPTLRAFGDSARGGERRAASSSRRRRAT